MTHKKVVCVLGMHRSGTSAITRVLNLIGINLGKAEDLMKPDIDNPKGYWENLEIVNIHDEILNIFLRTWDSELVLPKEWWKKSEIIPYRTSLTKIVQDNFSKSKNNLWMWKDPRTALMIPLWLEIFKNLNITLHFVICIRNPLDVYNSLRTRNQFSKEKAFRLWNLYTLSSLYWTINEKRTLVHYDSLLNDMEGTIRNITNELNIKWSQFHEQIFHKITTFLDGTLRHSYSSLDQFLVTDCLHEDTKILYPKILEVLNNPSKKYNDLHELVEVLYNKLPLYKDKF